MFSRLLQKVQAAARHRAGARCWKAMDLENAARLFREALQLDQGRSESWWALGWIGFAKGSIDKAIRCWNQAIELQPNYLLALAARAWGLISLGKFEEAKRDLDEAIRINPCALDVRVQRAELHLKLGRMDAAIADASKALSLHPRHGRAYHARAFAQLSRGALLESVDDYTKVIALIPSSSSSFYARALCHYARGRWDAALEDLRTSRNLGAPEPTHRDSCVLREWMVDLRRQRATYPRSAPVRATEAHLGDLKDPWIRCLAGAMLGEETEPPLELLLAAPQQWKSQAECQAYFYLGFRSLMLNDADEARRHFERVRDSGRCDFFEHALALHELRQLSSAR